ncbi:DUF3597 domain-containing protein [Tsuneonella troitsensis]|jgi:hypothetical protein|uniref:DUF3597 domain-containing protein n=1 Tax=Tsuneonella troitsensis TaxID=292222 RepID=UPI00070D3935|nr:DUF3597 domain-containing protein [Tsuneonella troitsensis]OGS48906.1 MAG: hypothetical protein A3J40_12905 [Erythrobacter sp. RIFCSPHIGHO2_12_FULL_63_10]
MSIFGKIKDAIFGKAHAEPAPPPTIDTTQVPGTPAPTPAPSTTAAVTEIDVTNSLDSMPGADRLNWRTSIVDLMKLIGVDSDYDSRKALAQELGRTDYSGTAEDNVWLHRKVMGELSRNGGKVPAEFLD